MEGLGKDPKLWEFVMQDLYHQPWKKRIVSLQGRRRAGSGCPGVLGFGAGRARGWLFGVSGLGFRV